MTAASVPVDADDEDDVSEDVDDDEEDVSEDVDDDEDDPEDVCVVEELLEGTYIFPVPLQTVQGK